MEYFKPDKYYYIIPILQIDSGIKLFFDDSKTNGVILHDYVCDKFTVLKELDKELSDIRWNDQLWRCDRHSAQEKLANQTKIIDESLEFLGLPRHILAIGNNDEITEPVTGMRLINHHLHSSIRRYRVSDCDLYQYHINDYETKIRNFVNPNAELIELAHEEKDEFKKELNYFKCGAKVKKLK